MEIWDIQNFSLIYTDNIYRVLNGFVVSQRLVCSWKKFFCFTVLPIFLAAFVYTYLPNWHSLPSAQKSKNKSFLRRFSRFHELTRLSLRHAAQHYKRLQVADNCVISEWLGNRSRRQRRLSLGCLSALEQNLCFVPAQVWDLNIFRLFKVLC